MKKFLALLLALVMALSLVACGGGGGNGGNSTNPNAYSLGDCEVELKAAKIAPDDNGAASVILWLALTNNGDSGYTYGYSVSERGEQAGEFMFIASLGSISEDHYYVEAMPGETVDILTGFNLNAVDYQGNLNYTDEVKITITDSGSDKSAEITVNPADMPFADSALDVMSGSDANSGNGGDAAGASTDGFGDFGSILVPEEFEFKRDSWNEENPHFVSVKRSDFAYFDFHSFTTEEELMKDYEYCKKTYTNEQEAVSANYGGIDWTGFQYGDGMGGYGIEVYAIMGSYYVKVSSAGFAFDHEIAKAVLGSVVMADGSGATGGSTGSDIATEVGGIKYNGSLDWLNYWNGNWYGWWLLKDGTGVYADLGDGTGAAMWDACAIIEAYEDTAGYMEVWDTDDTVVAMLDLNFANPDDTEYGVMCCGGGQFLGQEVEKDAWYVNPDELAYENIFDFRGEVEDEYGTYSYRVLLRPWGVEWDDLDEAYYPDTYYDWYLPLIEAGKPMPESIG